MPNAAPIHRAPGYRTQQQRKAAADALRGSAHARGYTREWGEASAAFLREHPVCQCEDCARLPTPLPSQVTDHRIPHKGDMRLFWDRSNWQAMAKVCHDRKTARDDGAFGR